MEKKRGDIATRFQPKPGSLASKPISVLLNKEIDAVIRALPDRSDWLRRVITEAAQRELMTDDAIARIKKDGRL
jgi:hypothetical protein